MNVEDLRRRARRGDAELQLRDGRAWVVVVGTVDAARAGIVADLVDELARQRALRRISVDLTCTVCVDRGAVTILGALRAGAPPRIDITTAGPLGRLHAHGDAA